MTIGMLDGVETSFGSMSIGTPGPNVTLGLSISDGSVLSFQWSAPLGLVDGDVLATFSFLTGVIEALPSDDLGDFYLAGLAPVLGQAPLILDPVTSLFTASVNYDLQAAAVAAVPLPAPALLLLASLAGLVGFGRLRRA
jgi:hypothetical protein